MMTRSGFYVLDADGKRVLFSNGRGVSGFFHPEDARNWMLGMVPKCFSSKETARDNTDPATGSYVQWRAEGYKRPSQMSVNALQRYQVRFNVMTTVDMDETIKFGIKRLLQGDPFVLKSMAISPLPPETIDSVHVVRVGQPG